MIRYIIIWLVIFLAVVAVGLMLMWMYYGCKGYEVSDFCINTEKELPSELNIVMISDLHNTDVGDNNSEVLEEIDRISPDFIILAGDMITSYIKPERSSDTSFSFIESLAEKYPVYYGLGNHEQRFLSMPDDFPGRYEELESFLKNAGVRILSDEHCYIEGSNCCIYGLNIPLEYYRKIITKKLPDGYIEQQLGQPDEDKLNILIGHTPDQIDSYVEWGADVVCAGHVHGGMVRLPFLGGVISPQYKLFPKYDAGLYNCGNTTMILSRGMGWHTIPVRINNKPEIVHITIKGADKDN